MNQSDRELIQDVRKWLQDVDARVTKIEESVNKGKGALGLIMLLISVAGLILGSIKIWR